MGNMVISYIINTVIFFFLNTIQDGALLEVSLVRLQVTCRVVGGWGGGGGMFRAIRTVQTET